MTRAIVAAALAVWAALAHAEPTATTSDVLRQGNAAALAGEWRRVADLVGPLLERRGRDNPEAPRERGALEGPLAEGDLGEAHRLAGLAAFFLRSDDAERHFLAYLGIEPDARLD